MGHDEGGTGLAQDGVDLRGVFERRAERFLTEDRLAGAGGGDDRASVKVMGETDIDGIDVAVAKESFNTVIDLPIRCAVVVEDELRS
jgi:hypothetical protein